MSITPRSLRGRRATAVLAASALGLGGAGLLLGAGTGAASSHKEAPLLLSDPQVDHTDLYAFVSPDDADTVSFIMNTQPFQDPAGGPNFYPFADQARYNIEIDTDGDAVTNTTYRWTFETEDNRGEVTFEDSEGQVSENQGSILYNNGPVESFGDATLLFKQTYTLEKIDGEGAAEVLMEDVPVAPSRVGDASMPDYQALRDEATVDLDGGGKTFAGQADDPFFLDLRIFNLVYGADLTEIGNNTTAQKNVNTIALQVPISDLVTGDDPVIGVHTTTERPSMRVQGAGTQEFSGDFVQVSRLGAPLVNEAVIPSDLKDAFNSLAPEDDATVDAAVAAVEDPEIPYLLESIYGLPRKEAPRSDLVSIFLTGLKGLNQPAEVTPAELLRLNTSIEPTADPERLGVLAGDNQGFPNGRRLADDVVDIELQALAGAVSVDEEGAPTGVEIVEALAAGDAVDTNDKDFLDSFPYVALPHSGSAINQNDDGGSGGGETPGGGVDAGFGGLSNDSGGLPVVPVGLGLLGMSVIGGGLVLLRNRS